MIDMQTNNKLKERAIRIISETLNITENRALELFEEYGSIRSVVENHN